MGTPSGGYYNAAGIKVPSVTTVISKSDDKSALIKWGYKQGLEHGRLRALGQPAPRDLYDVSQKAADAGSIAHDLIEYHVLNDKDPTPEIVAEHEHWAKADEAVRQRARNCYGQYLRWRKQTNIVIDRTETGGVSELYQYGGTYDGFGHNSDGEPVLIDWKTSNAVYGSMLIQLAAYGQIIRETRGIEVKEYHLLRMAKESADFAHHSYIVMADELRAFILMRELYDLTFKIGKRA
jgi:hypothetical protein